MQFLYCKEAGKPIITLKAEPYRYLFKVRRHRVGEKVQLRTMQDATYFCYEIVSISKREATLKRIDQGAATVMPKRTLHLGWCLIEPKVIEKHLPMLNELGVDKISFVYCARSQRHFRLDMSRLEKIAIASSQQCGRSKLMEFEHFDTLDAFLARYPHSYLLDFQPDSNWSEAKIETVLVGCEGGFTPEERAHFQGRIVGFDTPLILRSETAATAVAAKLLL